MAIALPDQCPTGLVYNPPKYPVKSYLSQAGGTHRILFGDQSFGATLELEYQLSNQGAILWMQTFEQAKGEFLEVDVDVNQWSAATGILETVPPWIRWHFSAPPRLERVFRDRVRLSVNLTGDLESS